MKKVYVTRIHQSEVKILSEVDFDGYKKNKPGKDWELVEHASVSGPERVWVPAYMLKYPKISDFSKVTIDIPDEAKQ